MFKKILVAIDGSPSSQKALEYAVHLAHQEKAELSIITAAEPLPSLAEGATPTYLPQYQDELHKNLEKMQKEGTVKLKKKYPDMKITAQVKDGRPATVIQKAAEDADLIVIGHRGNGGILSWVLGSVAKELLDQCTVPVLVVKDKDYC